MTSAPGLKSLDEHNSTRLLYSKTPRKNGLACPKCGAELFDLRPGVHLTVAVGELPCFEVMCCTPGSGCGYHGTRF